ncbi:FHA domain-containing protein [Anaerobaca lacustris]|uniref:FHA domain-containing protein n=1 Tax=Anaerobaca lacustris TaxID=3044600 RepID=A0AAW6U3X7_9BACT|nr:FHA domain-containing protein [Sedimentisphaerales bacterium M17dextr]
MSETNKICASNALLSQMPVGAVTCPACGHPGGAGATFCPDCGHRLDRQSVPAAEQPTGPQRQESDVAEEPTDAETQEPASDHRTANTPRADPPMCCCGCQPVRDAAFCHSCGAPIERQRKLQLVCEANGQRLGVMELDGCDVTIGRDEGNRVVIRGDRHASGRHAHITCQDGMLILEDLRSSNGTFLRLHRPVTLEVGDEFIVGTTLIRLEAGAGS